MEKIIQVKNISKSYKITHERGGYISLRDVMMNIAKRPFSYLKTKAKSVTGLVKKENFWALKDVDFAVNKGEVIGIIGKNGAGKSTLLKILSRITEPTEGEIIMRGSVGSLLEVGTGFHPELTGRENIFLNGAILGMTKREMAKKFDQIVEFAGIGKFIDTPVKHYSSGMYVRLAFSVAAHIEPDILIVDEVLAVGDAEFQKKCLGKMEEVTHQDGRTIIFVSHNLSAIEQLCKRTILLEDGQIKMIGETADVIDFYLSSTQSLSKIEFDSTKQTDSSYQLLSLELENNADNYFTVRWDEPILLKLKIKVNEKLDNMSFAVSFVTLGGTVIFWVRDSDLNGQASRFEQPGIYDVRINIKHNLRAGKLYLALAVIKNGVTSYHDLYQAVLEIIKTGKSSRKYFDDNRGLVNCGSAWEIKKFD